MKNNKGFHSKKLSMGRRTVIASASVTSEKNTIHAFTEIDVSGPRRLLADYFNATKQKLSFTAYIAACLAQAVRENPYVNSFLKGNKQIFLDEINISVLVEKEIAGENIPEPVTIKNAETKSVSQISQEIKAAKDSRNDKIGEMTGISWIRFIPKILLKLFVRIADQNISMAKTYGKIGVTAIGMYSKEGIWFIPHGSGTVLITVGSISDKVVEDNGKFVNKEHLSLTASFDHDIIDGAPATRFLNRLIEIIKEGNIITSLPGQVK